jgi:hypothetical protein
MVTTRKAERTRKLPTFTEERHLSDKSGFDGQRLLAAGLLIFALAFCALVFQAGWKEIAAHEGCGAGDLQGCDTLASGPAAEAR